MDPSVAKISTKKITTTATSLEPSALVVLYEVDLSDLLINSERRVMTDGSDFGQVLRFHNNLKLIQTSIFYGHHSDGTSIEYHPAPIKADGFETSAKGSPPTPKLSMTFNFEGLPAHCKVPQRFKFLR